MYDNTACLIPLHFQERAERGRLCATPRNLRGDTIVERLEAFDNAARSYCYSILRAPFPVSGYLSTLCVQQAPDGNRSRVEWSGKFTPEGVSAVEASRLFQRIFEDGLKALAIKFT